MRALLKYYYKKLNAQQRMAVDSLDKHILLLAGPGSGKTTVMICRAVNLIENHKLWPSQILNLTFGKASSRDMEDRFKSMFGTRANYKVEFSTIHRFANRVVKSYANYAGADFKLIEEEKEGFNKTILLKEIYKNINGNLVNDDKLEELKNAISLVKNMLIDNKEIPAFVEAENISIDNFTQIFYEYENIKGKNNYIDFDDMLTLTYKIFKNYPEILEKCRGNYKFIQVDEGQDVSKVQYEIIKMIAGNKNNLFIVADDDQSIYGFRGADPKGLLNFKMDFNDAKVLLMEQNYRSTQDIVSVSNEFIKTNKMRYNKNLFTENRNAKPIDLIKVKNEIEQFDYILKQLKGKKDLRDIAILFRNNISAVALADVMHQNGVPFYMKDFKQYFFKHWVTQDIIAFLSFAINQRDIHSFERIYYKMSSYVSKKSIEFIKNNSKDTVFDILLRNKALQAYQIDRLKQLKFCFNRLTSLGPKAAIDFIEMAMDYREYLETRGVKLGYSIDNLNMMLANLKLLAQGENSIVSFLFKLDNMQEIMDNSKNNRYKNAVTLSTIHASKGLEYQEVYMIDIVEDYFPSAYSIEQFKKGCPEFLEEERRLFYVGMTRAKDRLQMILPEKRGNSASIPSRFVFEVNRIMSQFKEKEEYKELESKRDMFYMGCKVKHGVFGIGNVNSVNLNKGLMEINFETVGKKTLSIDACIKNGLVELVV